MASENPLDNVADELFSTLPLIHRSIRRKLFRTALSGFNKDITPPHFEIMKLLQETGTLHVAEIGERLQIARPQMTHMIDKLVEMGFVERQPGNEDRRTLNITLNSQGKTVLSGQERHIRNAAKEALSNLPEETLRDLSASLRKLQEIFSQLK
ncbi:MAG: MarR family transcriptional regulator [Dehalococcoidales bacterium]